MRKPCTDWCARRHGLPAEHRPGRQLRHHADEPGGRAIALETKARGIRMVLSPVVNLATDVRWGRVEETYGEDPLLASWMGVAYVMAMERSGIITTPKHFVANHGDGGRDSYPAFHSERLLRETYLKPFEACIKHGRCALHHDGLQFAQRPSVQRQQLAAERCAPQGLGLPRLRDQRCGGHRRCQRASLHRQATTRMRAGRAWRTDRT
jgi:beta-glucosidase-like glycosyl hydrolase